MTGPIRLVAVGIALGCALCVCGVLAAVDFVRSERGRR
jgi:hypothetical protein